MPRTTAHRVFPVIIALILILAVTLTARQPVQATSANAERTAYDPVDEIIEKYRALIPELMKQKHIPGVAVALVDKDQVLWSEGFGYTDWDRATPVTADTPFSVQSTSKWFTATAVMLAVQDGLVDLDTPIGQYLPDFRINSIFEENPGDKITLRHLLSHTAGFTHEAPLGNNFHATTATFQEHVDSIQQTWLKFPVGQGYSYSNLGIDLAAYVIQVRSGMPFTDYVQQKLLQPLGMVNSTFDLAAIQANPRRAIGHDTILENMPLCPLLGSGGLYTSANDLARFLLFLSDHGKVDGQQVLDYSLIEAMESPQFVASSKQGYGLGVGVVRNNNTILLNHGGGGFGFMSMLYWYPELQLGMAWLANSTYYDMTTDLTEGVLSDVIEAKLDTYQLRVVQNTAPPQRTFNPGDVLPLSAGRLESAIQDVELPTDANSLSRWRQSAGVYYAVSLGRAGEVHWLRVKRGRSMFDDRVLYEVQPGLFFAGNGEALDLRGPIPTWRSINLYPLPWAAVIALVGFAGLCALVFLYTLGGLLVSGIRRMKKLAADSPAEPSRPTSAPAYRWLLAVGSILGLGVLVLYSFFPMLLIGKYPSVLNPNLNMYHRIALTAPLALFVLGAAAVLLRVLRRSAVRSRLRVEDLTPFLLLLLAVVVYF